MANTKMETFLMTKITEEKVLFSSAEEHGIDENKESRTVVKFKKPKPKPVENTETTTKDVINKIDASMDIVKGCLKVGAFIVPSIAPGLLALAGMAAFVQASLKLVPDDTPDPVDEKLKELEKSIFELEKKMNAHFADLKSFVTEVEFTVEIISEASTLMKYMRDVLKYRTPEAMQNFREAYEQSSPLILSYTITSLLDRKSTNPLRMELDSEPAKTKATFNKWEKCINGVLGQLLFIEAFASGLLKSKNTYNWDRILEQTTKVQVVLHESKEEFLKEEKYWGEMKTWLEKYIPENTDLNNMQKCKEIAKKLDTYLTNDQFHVIVMNENKWQYDYTYHCPNESTQILGVWRKGKCNAFIYRSRKAYQMDKKEFEKVRADVLEMRDNKAKQMTYNNELNVMMKRDLIDKGYVRSDGLVCIIDNRSNPHIEVANCNEEVYPKGPGFWENSELKTHTSSDADVGTLIDKMLLVSFP